MVVASHSQLEMLEGEVIIFASIRSIDGGGHLLCWLSILVVVVELNSDRGNRESQRKVMKGPGRWREMELRIKESEQRKKMDVTF